MTTGARYAVIFLFLLSLLGSTANLLFTAREVNAVKATQASTVQLCQSGNEARGQQVQLWQFVISISKPPPHETAAQKRQREATLRTFEAYLHRVFMPRNCTALGRNP